MLGVLYLCVSCAHVYNMSQRGLAGVAYPDYKAISGARLHRIGGKGLSHALILPPKTIDFDVLGIGIVNE